MGHPCQKKTIKNSLKLQIVLLMLLMVVIISSSYVLTRLESPNSPAPLPPPHPTPHNKRLRLINDFTSIAGKLIHIQPENFQWQFFCGYLYPGICICFIFSSRIPGKSYKSTAPESAVTRSLTSRSEYT